MTNKLKFVEYMHRRTGMSIDLIDNIIFNSDKEFSKVTIYTEHKRRALYIPSNQLKLIQICLIDYYFKGIPVSDNAHGYIRNKSIKSNALVHQGQTYFFQTDISSFFPSIDEPRLRATLIKVIPNITIDELDMIIRIVAPFGRLDLGSPTSPILSNIVMKEVDDKLLVELEKLHIHDLKYSRYSDDITISSKAILNTSLADLVESVLRQFDFIMNKKKTKFKVLSDNLKITGVYLNSDRTLTVGAKIKKKLKKYLYQIERGQDTEIKGEQVLGLLSFVKDIEPEYYLKLILKYSKNEENIVSKVKELINK